jgi:hypothetical protein
MFGYQIEELNMSYYKTNSINRCYFTNLLSLINLSLAYIYCSTTWSNYWIYIVELASIYAVGFVIGLYLILLIGVQISDVMRLKFSPMEPNRPC